MSRNASNTVGAQTDSTAVPYNLQPINSHPSAVSAENRVHRIVDVNRKLFLSPTRHINKSRNRHVIVARHRPNGICGDVALQEENLTHSENFPSSSRYQLTSNDLAYSQVRRQLFGGSGNRTVATSTAHVPFTRRGPGPCPRINDERSSSSKRSTCIKRPNDWEDSPRKRRRCDSNDNSSSLNSFTRRNEAASWMGRICRIKNLKR